jgi:hypothetical protein
MVIRPYEKIGAENVGRDKSRPYGVALLSSLGARFIAAPANGIDRLCHKGKIKTGGNLSNAARFRG